MKPFIQEKDYHLRNFSTFSKEESSPSNRGHLRVNSLNTGLNSGFNERSLSKDRYSPKATNVAALPSRFRNDRELVELFEECEGQILFWKSRYERLIEENIQLKESILETTNELEEFKRAGGSGRNQYVENENKSLLDKIRIQTSQLQNAFQDNENLRQRLIDKSRDTEKLRSDYENRIMDLESKSRRGDSPNIKSRIGTLEFELEEETRRSFEAKKLFERKEADYQGQIRDMNKEIDQLRRKLFTDRDNTPASPARSHARQNSYSHQGRSQSPSAQVDRLVRNLNKDLSMHDFNLEKIKELLVSLERLKFSNNTPLIRDLIESISQMKQQFIDSRDVRQETIESLINHLQSGDLSAVKNYDPRHPSGRSYVELDSLRAEVDERNEKIRSFESHINSLREQNSYLESELNVKQDLVQELRKRIEYNEENMRIMSEEYKNHLKSAYELQYQSIDYSNDEIVKLKEHITEIREQNLRLQSELNEKDVALNTFRQRNKKLLEQLNFQETEVIGSGFRQGGSESQFFKGEIPMDEQHPLNDQEKYFRLKERREQLDFLVKIGLRLSPAYFNEMKPYYDNLKFNNVTNIVKFNDLIGRAEGKLIEEVDHMSISADSSNKQMQMTIKGLREELVSKNQYIESLKRGGGIEDWSADLSPEELEREVSKYRNVPTNDSIRTLVKENISLKRRIQESGRGADYSGRGAEYSGSRGNMNQNYYNQMDLQSTQRQTRINQNQEAYGGNTAGPINNVTPFEPVSEQSRRGNTQNMSVSNGGGPGTMQGYGQASNSGFGQNPNLGYGQSPPNQGYNPNQNHGQNVLSGGQNQGVKPQDLKPPANSVSNEETLKRLVRETVSYPAVGNFKITVLKAKNILGVEKKGKLSNAYCRLIMGKERKNTKIIDSLNPEWNQSFSFPVNILDASKIPVLHVEVMDNDIIGDEFLGDCQVELSESLINPGLTIDLEKKLENLTKRKIKGTITGSVFLKIAYESSSGTTVKSLKPQGDIKNATPAPNFGGQGGKADNVLMKSNSGGASGTQMNYQIHQNSQNNMGELAGGGKQISGVGNSGGNTMVNPQSMMGGYMGGNSGGNNGTTMMGGSGGGLGSNNLMGSGIKQGSYMNAGSNIKSGNMSGVPGEYMASGNDTLKNSQKMNLLKQNEAMLENQKFKNTAMTGGGGISSPDHMVDSFGHSKGGESYHGGAPNFGGGYNPSAYQGYGQKESDEETVFKNSPAKKNLKKDMMFIKN